MGISIREDDKQFIGSFQEGDASDMLEFDQLERMVGRMNEMLAEEGYDYKFKVETKDKVVISEELPLHEAFIVRED